MVVSYRSQTFQDAFKEAEDLIELGNIASQDDMEDFVKSKGMDLQDYADAYYKFEDAKKAGETDFRAIGDFTPVAAPIRTVGRFVGEVGEGVGTLADLVTGGYASDVGETVAELLPERLQEFGNEIFDPYHGDSYLGAAEDITGTIGSYIAGGGLLLKGAGFAAKTVRGLTSAKKVTKPGSKSLITQKYKNLNREARRKAVSKARAKQKVTEAGKKGVALAGATTLIDRPEDGIVNMLVDMFPESTEYLERLYVNPDDSEAEALLKSFIGNLGIAVPFGMFTLAAAYKKPIAAAASTGFKPIKEAVKELPYLNKLPSLGAYFSSRLGTDDTMLSLLVKVSKGTEAGIIRAEGLAADLGRVAREEYGGKSIPNKIMDKALKGDTAALNSLKPKTKEIISEMRDNIDSLSKEARSSGIKGKFGATIDKGLGTYVTRSYDFFDDASFKKDILGKFKSFVKDGKDEQGVFGAALNDIVKMTGQSSDEALITLRKMLRAESDDAMAESLENITKFGNFTTVKSGRERSELLTESGNIRALLGEVKDPFKNYVKTVGNLSRITAEQKFLAGTAKHLKSKFGNETVEGLSDLTQVGSNRLSKIFGAKTGSVTNPLENVYATKAYKNAIEEGLNVIQSDSFLGQAFAKSKGVSQAMKTIANPSTHGRNIMGNAILMAANGMIPFIGKGGMKSLSTTFNMLANKTNKELGERLAEYTELGIIGSGVQQNVIKNNLKKYAKDPDAALLSSISKDENKVLGAAKVIPKKVTELYQAEDDIFKIAHYEKTLAALKKSPKYKDQPIEVIKDAAAQRTRDMMPNYNLVPKAFKNLRAMPVGDFMAFPAEMTRVTKNLVKYSVQDLASGDATLMKEGAKRLAGFTTMGYAPLYFSEKSRIANGITDDQAEALENIGKDWEFNQDKIYLSPITKDKNNHLGVKYFNLGPIDPFSYLKTGAQTAHALIANGIMDDDAIAYETDKLALSTLDQVFGPFLAPSMVTEALVTAIAPGQYGDSLVEGALNDGLADRLAPLAKTFTPGFVDYIIRRNDFYESQAKQEGIGREALKKFGATYKEYEIDMPAAMGLKRDYLDITAGLAFNVAPIVKETKNSIGKFRSTLMKDPNLNDPDELTMMYYDSQKRKFETMQRLNSIIQDYRTIFGERDFYEEFDNGLTTGRRMPKDEGTYAIINQANENKFSPDPIPFGDYLDVTRPALDFRTLEKLRRDMIGLSLMPTE
tara:strand:+ start:6344 stop:10009 length:3666 start_codon:yes stop_codon:yes gene_type:complete